MEIAILATFVLVTAQGVYRLFRPRSTNRLHRQRMRSILMLGGWILGVYVAVIGGYAGAEWFMKTVLGTVFPIFLKAIFECFEWRLSANREYFAELAVTDEQPRLEGRNGEEVL